MRHIFLLGVFTVFSIAVLGSSFSLPLTKKNWSGVSLPPRWFHHGGTAQVREFNNLFWFANFTVGARDDLEMLIDTGSTDVFINSDAYTPSKYFIDLHQNFTAGFGTTNSNGSGTKTLSGPLYEDIVALDHTQLSVHEQIFGVAKASPPTFSHAGLVGFAGPVFSQIGSVSWFQNLCSQRSLDHCRFGLAFETDDTGIQYFGDVKHDRFVGPLSVAPVFEQWLLFGDIAANGMVVEKDAVILTDSGTTVIFGPIDSVRALFDAAGVQSVLRPNTTANSPTTLDGYYPCVNPPQLGFGFPSSSDASSAAGNSSVSNSSTIFNVLPSQLAENSTDGNCTAVIHGTSEFSSAENLWILGQAFFQGRYIDHNVDNNTMGFANLLGY